ncbi:hypothetical protein IAI18_16075 [Acetobacteraceae bacterium H6797]|nr:hypothetical protein [Acetobacteraceae bacterium H6797]
MSASPQLAIMAAIDSMNGTVAIARALAESGRRIDLTGLDREVAQICAASVALGQAEGRALRPALEGLLHEITALREALQP